MLSIGNSKTKKEKQLRSGGGHNHLMPKLILEPDSTGGESKKNKNKKEKQVLQYSFVVVVIQNFLSIYFFKNKFINSFLL
jgi:hypothetical protein